MFPGVFWYKALIVMDYMAIWWRLGVARQNPTAGLKGGGGVADSDRRSVGTTVRANMGQAAFFSRNLGRSTAASRRLLWYRLRL